MSGGIPAARAAARPAFSAIVFDLDGTLVHSAPDLHAAANRMLAEIGRAELSLAAITGFIGNGVRRLVERCLDATGGADAALREEAIGRFNRHYGAASAALTRPFDGVIAAASGLRARGLLLGVCTNKPQDMAETLLAGLGLAPLFAVIVGATPGQALKPDPISLRRCIERLGAEACATLYVGDSEIDAATAVNAGLAFALFTGGYRRAPVEALPAAFAFDRFDELEARILDQQAG